MTAMMHTRATRRRSEDRESTGGIGIEEGRLRASSEIVGEPLLRLDQPLTNDSKQVRELFGREVGPCIASFGCSHSRIPGKLYATNRAILFYSSLLGFERRIYLLHQDVLDIELFRTTSISIRTSDFEVYVFKGFAQRETVLQILTSLLPGTSDASASLGNDSTLPPLEDDINGFGSSPVGGPILQRALSAGVTPERSSSSPRRILSYKNLSMSKPVIGNRRRSVSDSLLTVGGADEPEAEENFDNEDPLSALLPTQLEELSSGGWEETRNGEHLNERVLQDLKLSCSLDYFFETFLATNAPFSLVRYQTEYVKDRDVNATDWITCNDRAAVMMARTLTFTHPIKTSMGLGPTEAKTTRQQRLSRFGDQGILLENTTCVDGIPGADSFRVRDRWVIESLEGQRNAVQLSSSFEIQFTKRTLFRSIIEKNIKKETGEWWNGYARMLHDVLTQKEEKGKVSGLINEETLELVARSEESIQRLEALLRSSNMTLKIVLLLLLVIISMMGFQIVCLREELTVLREVMIRDSHQSPAQN